MLKKTGTLRGKPAGIAKEKKLDRDLRRQYEAADAIAFAGYAVANNPQLLDSDLQRGIRKGADPDFRIEGLIFDCYTPYPASIARANARQDAFDLAELSSEFDDEWEDEWSDYIRRTAKALVLDGIRKHVQDKVHSRQAFNIVVNITDVADLVNDDEVARLFTHRPVDHLEHVLLVYPARTDNATTKAAFKEKVSGYVGKDIYEEWYDVNLYSADVLLVTEVTVLPQRPGNVFGIVVTPPK